MDIRFTLSIDRKALDLIAGAARANLGKAVAKVARDIEGQAKAVVPVDTGFLKNSIQARPLGPLLWEVTVGAHYGVYVEFGTVRMAARPYLGPAVERMQPIFNEVIIQAVERAAREAGG